MIEVSGERMGILASSGARAKIEASWNFIAGSIGIIVDK
jgi:hypothetical protein